MKLHIIGLHRGHKYSAREVQKLIKTAILQKDKGNRVMVDWYNKEFTKELKEKGELK